MKTCNLKLTNLTKSAGISCRNKYNSFIMFLVLMQTGESAYAAGDVSSWFSNTQRTFNPAMTTITGIFYLGGAFFMWSGITKMREHGQNPQIKVSSILIDLFAGAAAIGFAYFGGGIRQQIFGGGDVGGTGGFTNFQ